MSGVNKVVYCARAKTFLSSELANVDSEGVKVATKALQVRFYFNQLRESETDAYVFRDSQDYNNSLASRRAGRSAKSKAMLYSFAKFKDVFDDWTVDETRVVNPNDGKWQAAAEVAQRVFFETKELEDGE